MLGEMVEQPQQQEDVEVKARGDSHAPAKLDPAHTPRLSQTKNAQLLPQVPSSPLDTTDTRCKAVTLANPLSLPSVLQDSSSEATNLADLHPHASEQYSHPPSYDALEPDEVYARLGELVELDRRSREEANTAQESPGRQTEVAQLPPQVPSKLLVNTYQKEADTPKQIGVVVKQGGIPRSEATLQLQVPQHKAMNLACSLLFSCLLGSRERMHPFLLEIVLFCLG